MHRICGSLFTTVTFISVFFVTGLSHGGEREDALKKVFEKRRRPYRLCALRDQAPAHSNANPASGVSQTIQEVAAITSLQASFRRPPVGDTSHEILDLFADQPEKLKKFRGLLSSDGKLTPQAILFWLEESGLLNSKGKIEVEKINEPEGNFNEGVFKVHYTPDESKTSDAKRTVFYVKVPRQGSSYGNEEPKNLIRINNGMPIFQVRHSPVISQLEQAMTYQDQNGNRHSVLLLHAAHGERAADLLFQPKEKEISYLQAKKMFKDVGRSIGAFKRANSNEKVQLAHGDLHLQNIFYDPKTCKVTFIDNGTMRMDDSGEVERLFESGKGIRKGLDQAVPQIRWALRDSSTTFSRKDYLDFLQNYSRLPLLPSLFEDMLDSYIAELRPAHPQEMKAKLIKNLADPILEGLPGHQESIREISEWIYEQGVKTLLRDQPLSQIAVE